MSYNLHSHIRSDRGKWAFAIISILLILAICGWLIAAAVMNVNPICLFKHKYDDNNMCVRCGKEKPVEEAAPEVENLEEEILPETEEPVETLVSKPHSMFASARLLNASPSTNEGLVPVGEGYAFVSSGELFLSSSSITDKIVDRANDEGLNNLLAINCCRADPNQTITLGSSSYFTVGVLAADYENGDRCDYYYFAVKKVGIDSWHLFKSSSFLDGNTIEVATNSIVDNGVYQLCVVWNECDVEDEGDEISNWWQSDIFTVNYGIEISSLPADPVKTGYTFTGWYTDEACTTKYNEQYVTSDITLYAGFRAHTYDISFQPNGGEGDPMDDLGMTYDVAANLLLNTYTKEHYVFMGWATSANGAVVYTNGQEVKNLTAEDGAMVDLFAVWKLNEVTVTFVVEEETTTTTVVINTSVTLPQDPVKEGHTFIGFFYDDGTVYNGQAITEDTTLTAYFEINKCIVTFIVDGEVYATYMCDWGTSIKEALNANDVNPLLMSLEGEYSRNF